MNRIAEANGEAVRLKVKSAKGKKAPQPRQDRDTPRLRLWATVGMGCGIPALSLSLSSIGGRLLQDGHAALGAASLGLCCTVLAVSLSHLAKAIRCITASARWQAWALAATVDLSLVVCELARVQGFDFWLVPTVMVGVTVASMFLNCYAFLKGGK